MKYNYCPVCGEKLPPHHHGKLCKNCSKKEFKKKAITAVVLTGVAVGAGAGVYYYVKNHKKEVTQYAKDLAATALALELKKISSDAKLLTEVAKSAYELASKRS